jgi:hypothetical protein
LIARQNQLHEREEGIPENGGVEKETENLPGL